MTMTIRSPDNLHGIIKQAARAKGYTINHLVLEILWAWAEQNEQTHAS